MQRTGAKATLATKEVNCEGYHCLLRRVFVGAFAVVLAFAVLKEVHATEPVAALEPGPAVENVLRR